MYFKTRLWWWMKKHKIKTNWTLYKGKFLQYEIRPYRPIKILLYFAIFQMYILFCMYWHLRCLYLSNSVKNWFVQIFLCAHYLWFYILHVRVLCFYVWFALKYFYAFLCCYFSKFSMGFFSFSLFFFRNASVASRVSQARGGMAGAPASQHHSHSSAGSEQSLWPTP